jgi:hypothetical protein
VQAGITVDITYMCMPRATQNKNAPMGHGYVPDTVNVPLIRALPVMLAPPAVILRPLPPVIMPATVRNPYGV